MVALRKERWTATEFLAWTARQSEKFELEGGHLVEMSAEQAKHALMKHAAARALEDAVQSAKLNCSVFPDGMTVVVDDRHVRLPDAAIQCAPVDPESTVLDQPVVLVEVTSPSSADRDENLKLVEYFGISSVHHYLLLSPDQRLVVHFRRSDKPNQIETTIAYEGDLAIDPPGFTVAVEALLGARAPASSQSEK